VGTRRCRCDATQRGRLAAAKANLEKGIAIYDPNRHRHHAFLFGQDAGIIGHSHLAWLYWLTGDPESGRQHISIAIHLAQKLSHAFSHTYSLTFATWLEQFMGNPSDCDRIADAAVASAEVQRFPLLLGMTLVAKGWAISALGNVAAGLETVRRGISLYQSTGAELGCPQCSPFWLR
jgi:predicted ATPase